MNRPLLSFVAVCAVLATGVGVSAATAPSASEVKPTVERATAPVARAGAVCPHPLRDADSETRVSMVAPGPAGSGAAELVDLGGRGAPRTTLASPGAAGVVVPAKTPPLVARASGGLAPGFAASMETRTSGGDLRALAGTSCAAPDTEFWFVGSGAAVGQRGRLYLSNPEAAPAVVDVTLYGPDGPIEAPGGRGVAIAAGAQRVLLLDALAPETPRFGVHVEVRQGRVAAALRDQQVDGLRPRGVDWVPAAAAPARRLVVPGVLAGGGERRLQLLVPGDSDAIVRVRLLGLTGPFAPAGLDVVEAPARSVTDVDLAPDAQGQNVAVELTSDVPITAGVLARTDGSRGQLEDLGYTAATEPLSAARPGVVAEVRGGKARSYLMLAAPGGDTTVDIVPVPPATGQAVTARVPAGGQAVVHLDEVSAAADFAVRVVPTGSQPVVASRLISEVGSRGQLFTVSPVVPGRYAVRVPAVSADLSTGLRPRD